MLSYLIIFGGSDGARTHTLQILSLLPLPIGPRSQKMVGEVGIEPTTKGL